MGVATDLVVGSGANPAWMARVSIFMGSPVGGRVVLGRGPRADMLAGRSRG
jgi:hypothetical protein